MLEVIRQDYIRTARAKGLKEGAIVRSHALKNCMIPVTTAAGSFLAFLMSGAIIVETIFSISGLGMYLMGGITARDYPVINGTVILMAFIVCAMNLIIDLIYAFIDPRIRSQYVSSKKNSRVIAKLTGNKAEVA
jgi:peptide/nickel transport system permease protein